MSISPDGALMAAGGSQDATLKIYRVKDQTLVRSVDSGSGGIYTTYFHPSGKSVVISTAGGPLKSVDIDSGKVTVVDGALGYMHNYDFSKDGRIMAGPAKNGVVVWDTKTWTEVRRFDGNQGGTTHVAVSPDGKYVASTGQDGIARVYSVGTGQEVLQLGEQQNGSRLRFSADGSSLVVAGSDGQVRIYGTSTAGRPAPVSAKKQEQPDDFDE